MRQTQSFRCFPKNTFRKSKVEGTKYKRFYVFLCEEYLYIAKKSKHLSCTSYNSIFLRYKYCEYNYYIHPKQTNIEFLFTSYATFHTILPDCHPSRMESPVMLSSYRELIKSVQVFHNLVGCWIDFHRPLELLRRYGPITSASFSVLCH